MKFWFLYTYFDFVSYNFINCKRDLQYDRILLVFFFSMRKLRRKFQKSDDFHQIVNERLVATPHVQIELILRRSFSSWHEHKYTVYSYTYTKRCTRRRRLVLVLVHLILFTSGFGFYALSLYICCSSYVTLCLHIPMRHISYDFPTYLFPMANTNQV